MDSVVGRAGQAVQSKAGAYICGHPLMSLTSQMLELLALMQGSCRFLTLDVLFLLIMIDREYSNLSIRDAMIGVMLSLHHGIVYT